LKIKRHSPASPLGFRHSAAVAVVKASSGTSCYTLRTIHALCIIVKKLIK
jgi:hypothetical protein